MTIIFGQEPLIEGGEITRKTPSTLRQAKPKGLSDIFKEWKIKYDAWLKGEGKTIEEGQKLSESKTGIEQGARLFLGEQAGDVVRDITNPENWLKQITRIAVILIVAMIGIMALLQLMPARAGVTK